LHVLCTVASNSSKAAKAIGAISSNYQFDIIAMGARPSRINGYGNADARAFTKMKRCGAVKA